MLPPQRGVTLIEVLLAVVLLAFGLFGVLDMYAETTRQVDAVRLQARLAGVAEGHLSQLQARGYPALEALTPSATGGEAGDGVAVFPRPRTSSLDGDFVWTARLARREVSKRPAIEIVVEARFQAPGSGSPDSRPAADSEDAPTHGRAGRLTKEATAYVFAR